jgi:hypothetical protein
MTQSEANDMGRDNVDTGSTTFTLMGVAFIATPVVLLGLQWGGIIDWTVTRNALNFLMALGS